MMRYTLLGESGLRVSRLCLGTMTFGTDWDWGADEAEARKQLEVFAESGGNFVDTANKYTNGSAEAIVGRLLAGQRERFVLATKYSLTGPGRRPQRRREPPQEPGPGARGVPAAPRHRPRRHPVAARLRGWSPFAGLQIPYSLAQREVERELIPMAHGLGLGITAWSPLSGGLLTGKYNRPGGRDQPRRLGEVDEDGLRIAQRVVDVAGELGVSPGRVALAWLLGKSVIPILGARTAEQLADNLGCIQVELSPAQSARLDEASAPTLGFPHDFLAGRDFIHDGGRDLIDLPPGRGEFGR